MYIHCPRCGKHYHVVLEHGEVGGSSVICTACRHEFAVRSFEEDSVEKVASTSSDSPPETDPIRRRLTGLWQEVLNHFENPEVHQEFLRLCAQLGELRFARDRYENLRRTVGDDPEIERRLQQLNLLVFQKGAHSNLDFFVERGVDPLKGTIKNDQPSTVTKLSVITLISLVLFVLGSLKSVSLGISLVGALFIIWFFLYDIKK